MTTDVAARSLVGGRYELEVQLGRGGMGEVWRAKHVALRQRVAIKFLHRTSAQPAIAWKRFESEAQITAQIKSRHAVQVFDYGVTESGQPYLVMELLDGETVGHRLDRDKRLTTQTTALFLSQAARALDRAHSVGIVHRDFKPDNLVIVRDEDGREYIKVLDFGIAKILGELELDSDDADPDPTLRGDHGSFTRTGSILGTPFYMAPEQIRNSREIDARADVWAFGVVAFECLAGRPPFDGKDIFELFERVQAGRHPRASELQPGVPAGFDAWFDVACAVDPTSRFASAKIAATQLVEALGDAPAASNSGPSLARSDDWVADNGPQSGDGGTRQTHGGKLLSRKRRSVGSSSASLQRIGIDATLEAPPPSPAGGAAPVTERRRRPASVKMTLAAIVMGGLAGGSVVYGLWPSTSKATSAPPAAATSAAAVKPAPAPPPPGADPPIASSPLASTTATEPATPSPERPTSELAAMPRARKATAPVADSHSARPPASAVPPPPAPPPAAASAPAPTRSAKSPFELPPLGI